MTFVNTDQASIASNMLQALNIVEPDLDTSVGTTVRNIIDVVAEQQSQIAINSNFQTYQYVVDSLSGSALDAFCVNFGFQRFQAKSATGVATFTQASSAIQLPSITIPAGTLIANSSGIVFQTVATYTLTPVINQANSIDIPIQAVVGGSNGNVAAGTITTFNTPLNGINSVTNSNATSGGSDAEADAPFRTRFKATVLRALTGTSQSFLGAALENPNVATANVLGSVVTHQEQISFTSGVAKSLLTDVGYVYPYNASLAVDLTNSTATTTTGTLTLETALTSGSAVTTLNLQAATSKVTLPLNTILIFGTQQAIVSSATVVGTSSTAVPVNSFTPNQNFSLSYSVIWIYNSGNFFTQGVDFSLSTTPIIADPTTAPTLALTSTGGTLGTGNYSYQWCYANFYGRTNATPAATQAVASGSTNEITISGWGSTAGIWVFIFGRTQVATTISGPMSTGGPITSIPTSSTAVAVQQGSILSVSSGAHTQQFVVSATTAASSSSIPVVAQTPNYAYPTGSIVALTQCLTAIPSTTTSWIDTGSTTPAGDLPAASTVGVQVQVNALSSAVAPGGSGTYQIQYDYIPASSRNLYPNILNCVDVYINGSNPTSASQSIPFYLGPEATSGPLLAPSGTLLLNSALSSGTTYTALTTTAPVTLPVGTFLYFGTQTAYVNQAAVNSSTVSISPFTPSSTYNTGVTYYYDTSRFNGFSASPLFVRKFQRLNGNLPTIGNKFIPLAFGPVLTLPSTIVSPTGAGSSPVNQSPATYTYNTNYWLVNETDTGGMSNQSLCGIEWPNNQVFGNNFSGGTAGSPTAVGSAYPMSVAYSFNSVPLNVSSSIQAWRLLSQDVMTHQAYPALLNFSFVIVPASGALLSTLQSQINAAISAVLTQVNFNQVLEASAVLSAVLAVTGVANARWAISADSVTYPAASTNYGIQLVNASGSITQAFVNANYQITDIQFTNITYPVFNQTTLYAAAQNSFTSGYAAFSQPL